VSRLLRFTLGVIAYAIGLSVLQAAGAGILAGVVPGPAGPNVGLWVLLSNLITAAVLAAIVSAARIRGWRLASGVALAWWVVAAATSELEAVFFHVLSPNQGWRLLLHASVVALGLGIISIPIEKFLRTPSAVPVPHSVPSVPGTGFSAQFLPGQWVGRLAACGAIYVFLYYAAGMVVITVPAVRDFYSERQLPPALLVAGLQLLVRGPAFGAVLALLSYLLGSDRRRAALAGAAMMCLIGGAAALIVPNPFFPDAVRWAHFVEVVSSNLVFGAIAGWLMTPPSGANAVAPSRAPLVSSSH
jgi:hypothetical protein